MDRSIDCRYALLIKDRATGLLVTTLIPDKTAMTVRNAFIQNWNYGMPQVVPSGNGRYSKIVYFKRRVSGWELSKGKRIQESHRQMVSLEDSIGQSICFFGDLKTKKKIFTSR